MRLDLFSTFLLIYLLYVSQLGYCQDSNTPAVYRGDESFDVGIQFLTAIVESNMTGIQYLVEAYPELDLPNAICPEGSPALLVATHKGDKDIVVFLLKSGADVNATDRDGKSAAHAVAETNDLDILEILINAKIDLNIISETSSTALSVASENGNHQVVMRLLEENIQKSLNLRNRPHGRTPLWEACNKGYTNIVAALLKEKADFSIPDSDGSNTVLVASKGGYDGIVEMLLRVEANPSTPNINGSTAIHVASANCHKSTLIRLTQKYRDALVMEDKDGYIPADLICPDSELDWNEYTLIQYYVVPPVAAIRLNRFDELRDSVSKNAYPSVLRNGRNLLHVAASFDNLKAAKYIKELYPEMEDEKDYQGDRPADVIGEFTMENDQDLEEMRRLFGIGGAMQSKSEKISLKKVVFVVVIGTSTLFMLLAAATVCYIRFSRRQPSNGNPHIQDKARKISAEIYLGKCFSTKHSISLNNQIQQGIPIYAGAVFDPIKELKFQDFNKYDITDDLFNVMEFEDLNLDGLGECSSSEGEAGLEMMGDQTVVQIFEDENGSIKEKVPEPGSN